MRDCGHSGWGEEVDIPCDYVDNKIIDQPSIIDSIQHQKRFVGFSQRKCPINPRSGFAANVSNPETWGTRAEAGAWAAQNRGHVGWMPLSGFLVFDFDGAVKDGALVPKVQEWIDELGGEVELSVSGTGAHVTIQMDDELREIVPHKIPITGPGLPCRRVDLITGHNGVILGQPVRPAQRPVAEQQAVAKRLAWELLAANEKTRAPRRRRSAPERIGQRTEEAGETWFDVKIARAARAHGCDRAYQAYVFAKTLDRNGSGFLPEVLLLDGLIGQFKKQGLKHPKRAATRLLGQMLKARFAERLPVRDTGRTVIRLPSPSRIAERLQTDLGQMAPIPVRECLTRSPRQWVYLGILRKRDGTPERPRPTSRAVLREMTVAYAATQRKAERKAGVRVEQNCQVGAPRPGKPWKHLADGRMVHRIANSTTVDPPVDPERLEERLVKHTDRRIYCYTEKVVKDAGGRPCLLYLGMHPLADGELVHLWQPC